MVKKTTEYIRIPKKPFFTVLIVLGISILIWALWPEVQVVETKVIRPGYFERLAVDEGVTEYENKQVIAAPTDGIVPHLEWEPGDKVKEGDKLFTFFWDRDWPVRSPIDGYILKVLEKDRRHVPRGTPILEIGNPENLRIVSNYLTEVAVDIRPGQKVLIENWGGEIKLEGVVHKVEPSAREVVSALGVKEQRVNVVIRITTPREVWKDLGDGYRVETSVVTAVLPEALLLPLGALFENESGPAVFTVGRDKKLDLKNIRTGPRNRDVVVIAEGLNAGDQVVMYPDNRLRAGLKVKTRSP